MASDTPNRWNDKAFIADEVTKRVLEIEHGRCRGANITLEVLLNEAALMERERLKKEKSSRETKRQLRYWSRIHREFQGASEAEREEILIRIVRAYVDEIHGNFNPTVHGLATRILPWFLKLVFSRVSPARLTDWGDRLNLNENLILTGNVETIRKLSQRATLILAPTHVSNLDSIVLGLGLHRMDLPPFAYGAGLNLFSNPVIAYFLNNLGAYKVDRRKKNSIYKDTLKQYAMLCMESGRHSLFFPGGTRNRRGDIEQHLKLGLMGCGLPAYLANLRRRAEKPDIFVVPATLSYGLVLEAKALIENQLREEGKSRFILERNIFSKPVRLFRFWRNLQSLNSKIHLRLCEPIDLFGNAVDVEGVSRDRHSRPINRLKYLEVKGIPAASPQRDEEYTRELGRAIMDSYLRNNITLSTHVAAFAAFAALRRLNPRQDFFTFLRHAGPEYSVSRDNLLRGIEVLLDRLHLLESRGGIRLEEELRQQTPAEVFDTALSHFSSFHDGEVLRCENGRVWSLNLKLLYYYRNRLDHYGLDAPGG